MKNSFGTEGSQSSGGGDADRNREHPLIVSEFSRADVEPDGKLDKSFWAGVERVRFDHAAFSRASYPEAETTVASRWTRKFLYLAFRCRYQTLNIYQGEDPGPERWQLWEKDVAEAFINPNPDHPFHYYEFEIAPNNQWLDLEINLARNPMSDAHWNSGFEHRTHIDPARHLWTVEMRIPVAAMTHTPIEPGSEWRVNFYRCDGPGSGNARRLMSWGAMPKESTEHTFHQPASFGRLRFAASGAKMAP